jgi:hypothetical protein
MISMRRLLVAAEIECTQKSLSYRLHRKRQRRRGRGLRDRSVAKLTYRPVSESLACASIQPQGRSAAEGAPKSVPPLRYGWRRSASPPPSGGDEESEAHPSGPAGAREGWGGLWL